MTRGEMKSLAKKQLRGRWLIPIIAVAFVGLIVNTQVISQIGEFFGFEVRVYANIPSLILGGALTVGLCNFLLKLARSQGEPKFTDIFFGFNIFLKTLGLNLLIGVIVMIGAVLLVVPGIIAALAFSQAYYIMAEDNSKSITECLSESYKMMDGYKMDFLILQLSFLGWWIVAALTFGIAGLWVAPYQKMTETNFYLEIKNDIEY